MRIRNKSQRIDDAVIELVDMQSYLDRFIASLSDRELQVAVLTGLGMNSIEIVRAYPEIRSAKNARSRLKDICDKAKRLAECGDLAFSRDHWTSMNRHEPDEDLTSESSAPDAVWQMTDAELCAWMAS